MKITAIGTKRKYLVMKSDINGKWALSSKSNYGRGFEDGTQVAKMFGIKYEQLGAFMEPYGAEVVEIRKPLLWGRPNETRIEKSHITWDDWRMGMAFIHDWIEPLILMKHMTEGGKK